jgi:hypothetical protein
MFGENAKLVYCSKCGTLNPDNAPSALIVVFHFTPLAWRTGRTVGVNIAVAIMKTNMFTIEEVTVALGS